MSFGICAKFIANVKNKGMGWVTFEKVFNYFKIKNMHTTAAVMIATPGQVHSCSKKLGELNEGLGA